MHWRNSKNSWGWITIAIHWITVLAVAGLLTLGLWMVDLGYYHPWYYKAPLIHKSIGMLLLGLTLFRIFWRMTNISPHPLESHTAFEKKRQR